MSASTTMTIRISSDLKEKLEMLIAKPSLITYAKKNIPVVKNFTEVVDQHMTLYNELLNLSPKNI